MVKYLLAIALAVLMIAGVAYEANAVQVFAAIDSSGAPVSINLTGDVLKQIAWEALKSLWDAAQTPAAIAGWASLIAALVSRATPGTAWWYVVSAVNILALNVAKAKNLNIAQPLPPAETRAPTA